MASTFLQHQGLILQCWETSCYARQRAHLKSFMCFLAKCVNLPGSILSWKLYDGMHVQLNNRSTLFCYVLCNVCLDLFVHMCVCLCVFCTYSDSFTKLKD